MDGLDHAASHEEIRSEARDPTAKKWQWYSNKTAIAIARLTEII